MIWSLRSGNERMNCVQFLHIAEGQAHEVPELCKFLWRACGDCFCCSHNSSNSLLLLPEFMLGKFLSSVAGSMLAFIARRMSF